MYLFTTLYLFYPRIKKVFIIIIIIIIIIIVIIIIIIIIIVINIVICGRITLLNQSIALSLTMLTGKNCDLFSSIQEFIEIEAWLLLTFFTCLHDQLRSTHSIVTHERVQMFEKGDSSNEKKMNGCSSQQVVRQSLN